MQPVLRATAPFERTRPWRPVWRLACTVVLVALAAAVWWEPLRAFAQASDEASPATADSSEGQAETASSAPATPVLTDPQTGERYIEVRPTQPLTQGRWPVAPWLVWGLGALSVVAGGVALVRRMLLSRHSG